MVGANAVLHTAFIYASGCVHVSVFVPLSQRASPCVCVALGSDTSSSGNPSRLPGQPAPTS